MEQSGKEKRMLIIIGSGDSMKFKALCRAHDALQLKASVQIIPVGSDISEQPIGFDETLRGALNRAEAVRKRNASAFVVGVENGLLDDTRGCWKDAAIIAVITPSGRHLIVESRSVSVPDDIVQELSNRSTETTLTIGKILAERFNSNPKDPHSFLTAGRHSRETILCDALTQVLRLAINIEEGERA